MKITKILVAYYSLLVTTAYAGELSYRKHGDNLPIRNYWSYCNPLGMDKN